MVSSSFIIKRNIGILLKVYFSVRRFSSKRFVVNTETATNYSVDRSRVFIYEGSRYCAKHIVDNEFLDSCMTDLLNTDLKNARLSASDILWLIDTLRNECASFTSETERSNKFFFDACEDPSTWTGLKKLDSDELAKVVNSGGESKNRLILGSYVMHMYCGLPERKVAAFLGISKSGVNRYIDLCRGLLLKNFIPVHLSSVSRNQVSQETTVIARTLHDTIPADETLITVRNGTYVYLHKSSNFEYQRVTYSGHKKTNYLKPMLVCQHKWSYFECFRTVRTMGRQCR